MKTFYVENYFDSEDGEGKVILRVMDKSERLSLRSSITTGDVLFINSHFLSKTVNLQGFPSKEKNNLQC